MRISYLSRLNIVPVLLGVLLRLINIHKPILGVHSWRQADTAAMARHFAYQGTPIWLPQIDWGGSSPGFVECEFPLFPYIVGNIYKLFGVHEFIGRGLSVLFSAITIFLVIRIGERLIDPISGFFGGLFFAIIPLSVYYGRTFQAESLMLMLAAFSIDRFLAWKERKKIFNLFFSWFSLCLACLIKVIPVLWLGIPLLLIQINYKQSFISFSIIKLRKGLMRLLLSIWAWIYIFSLLLVLTIWYSHAYQLGQVSGISFGFWGTSSDRSSLSMIFDISVWIDLLLRIFLRNLAIFGAPFLLIGMFYSNRYCGAQVCIGGIVSTSLCTAIALRASFVHEYYQLPLVLFLCPLMGLGCKIIYTSPFFNQKLFKFLSQISLIAILMTSLFVLHFDYWSLESKQSQIWMPLAQRIRIEVPSSSLVVSVTGNDPSLLNLGRVQGWLTNSNHVTEENLQKWFNEGATYIVGSLNWEETYTRFSDVERKNRLKLLLCKKVNTSICMNEYNKTYLIPINDLL